MTVSINADDLIENDERFAVVLNLIEANGRERRVALEHGEGTIRNDDGIDPMDPPTFSDVALLQGPAYSSHGLPLVQWSEVVSATYDLEIYPLGADPDLENPLLEKPGLNVSQYQLTPAEELSQGWYIARVRSRVPGGQPSSWSREPYYYEFYVDDDYNRNDGIQIAHAGDPYYEEVGLLTDSAIGSARVLPVGEDNSLSSWTFAVAPGFYEVHATWPSGPSHADDATYSLFDGKEGRLRSSLSVNQSSSPSGQFIDNAIWQKLGVLEVTGDTLEVILDDSTTGTVLADAVRIVPVGNLAGDPIGSHIRAKQSLRSSNRRRSKRIC